MKHVIYYFTGTGNALWTARKLAETLTDTRIIPIVSGTKADSTAQYSTTGIIFPVYMHRVPYIVADFIRELEKTDYLYVIGVNAGDTGIVFSHVRKLLSSASISLSAGFSIITPSNYLPFGAAAEGRKRDSLFKGAESKIRRISSIINKKASYFDQEASFFHTKIYPGIIYSLGYRMIPKMDSRFKVNADCNSCGVCEKICPVKNISLENGRPVWHHNCQMCFACINNCPVQAIDYGKNTKGVRRYRNPEIKLSELLNPQEEIS